MYEAKTVVRNLGLRYDKIDACPNDCILYRKEYEKMDSCPICGTSRWVTHDVKKQKHVPAKYLSEALSIDSTFETIVLVSESV